MKLLWIISVYFNVKRSTTNQIFCIHQILVEKKRSIMGQYISYL